MVIVNIKTHIPCDIYSVWDVVTSVKDYTWRSDLSRTEIVNEKQFIEYTKDGYPTIFTTTVVEPYQRWEFDMDNSNIHGHWIGIFTSNGEATDIDFTECVTVKNFYMKPFVKFYLKKQQAQFIADLQKALK